MTRPDRRKVHDVGLVDEVRVEVYRGFMAGGRAPTATEVAQRLKMDDGDVRGVFRMLADQDVIAFKPGTEDLWLAHPFCASQAAFDVVSGDRRWDAICIWDALGILALIGADGTVSTVCPDCDEVLEVRVVADEVAGPPEAIVHFGVPAARWYEDIGFT